MKIRKFLILIFFVFFTVFSGQNLQFQPTIKVIYEASLKLGDKRSVKENFVLIGNSTDYYFAANQNYLNDTNQYESNGSFDLQSISAYFEERVIRSGNTNYVLLSTFEGKILYLEKKPIKWVLYGDTKTINGIKCQLATTNLFGRRWFAYFSKEYSQNIGPYKFSGLPGLILELYDQRDDYHFTAVSIKEEKKEFKFNFAGFKNYSKKYYLVAKENLLFGMGKYPGLSGDMLRETQEMLEKLKKMANNPIELKPLE